MKKLFFLTVVAVAMLLTGCTSAYYMTGSKSMNINQTQTQVVLSHANFQVVKNVHTFVVYPNTMKLNSDELQKSAYAALAREANLTGSQCIINITVERVGRGSWFAFQTGELAFSPTESAVMVTGTVIEFTGK